MSGSLSRMAFVAGIVLLGLVVGLGGLGYWQGQSSLATVHQLEKSATLIQRHMESEMKHDALRGDVAVALAARDSATGISIDEIYAEMQQHSREFRQSVQEATELVDDPATKAAHDQINGPLHTYIKAGDKMFGYIRTDPVQADAYFGEFNKAFRDLQTAMDAASVAVEANAKRISEDSERQLSRNSMLFMCLWAGVMLIVAGLILIARQKVIRPLVRLADATEMLAHGRYDVAVPAIGRIDELSVMADALTQFRQASVDKLALQKADAEHRKEQAMIVERLGIGLRELADGNVSFQIEDEFSEDYELVRTDFNSALSAMASALRAVAQASETIKIGSGEIAQASRDLSHRTEQQAASLEETAAAMAKITTSVNASAEKARHVNRTVEDTRGDASEGGRVVKSAIRAMDEIEKSSHEINQIINMIDGIAFQTNLLALNAGVEAARAGDAGKGFAVVANEVRALAQRSADAAKDIKALISASARQVETGVKLVGQTGDTLGRIVEKVTEISSLIGDMTTAVDEEALGLCQVNEAVGEMDRMTQKNATMVEESTAAARGLANQAVQLMQLVSNFQIKVPQPREESGQRLALQAARDATARQRRRAA